MKREMIIQTNDAIGKLQYALQTGDDTNLNEEQSKILKILTELNNENMSAEAIGSKRLVDVNDLINNIGKNDNKVVNK